MANTASDGFDQFNRKLIPSEIERAKASSHRQTIYDKLDNEFGLYRMFQSGSFKHGTGISGHSDVDYFASFKTDRPTSSDTILDSVKAKLQERFPTTFVHISRPAVVLEFGQGYERVEIIPAYSQGAITDSSNVRFKIPSVVPGSWIESTPESHLTYVNGSDLQVANGSTKRLTRLVKAWKYYCNVPISSFYLEMRAASYMREQTTYYPWLDIFYLLKRLKDNQLAAMNDPTGYTGRIYACSTAPKAEEALSKLSTALIRAEKAMNHQTAGQTKDAFDEWDKLFGGKFPAFY